MSGSYFLSENQAIRLFLTNKFPYVTIKKTQRRKSLCLKIQVEANPYSQKLLS